MQFNNSNDFLNHIISSEEMEQIPCNKCDGDCCGPVEFDGEHLVSIFKKYSKEPEFRKRFKANSKSNVSLSLLKLYRMNNGILPRFKKNNQYLKAGIKVNSCIFKKDEKIGSNHCLIYEDRPLICKAYGTKTICCPYSNLTEQPTGFEKIKLINESHQQRQKNMIKHFEGQFK